MTTTTITTINNNNKTTLMGYDTIEINLVASRNVNFVIELAHMGQCRSIFAFFETFDLILPISTYIFYYQLLSGFQKLLVRSMIILKF